MSCSSGWLSRFCALSFPELRITGPSGDLNRDAFGRPLFGEHDKIVLLVSCEAQLDQ